MMMAMGGEGVIENRASCEITYFMDFNIKIWFKEMKMHLDNILFYFDYFG
jgi:hypothetical protein